MTPEDPLRLTVPRELAGERFDRALALLIPALTRSQLQKLVRRGRVKLDGKRVVRSNLVLQGGEEVLVRFDRADVSTGGPLVVLHEDPERVVVDKAAGMVMHPTQRVAGGTVSELAVERYGYLPGDELRPGIVHRLDRATSGLCVLARTREALEHLRAQFRTRTIEKRYLAIVHGAPAAEEFAIDAPVGPAPGQLDLQRIETEGRETRSRFRVLERFESFALLACEPLTGRRHQLRVHLASLGLPILGDRLYGTSWDAPFGAGRHALHAERLAFDHPRTGERETWVCEPPISFRDALATLRKASAPLPQLAPRPHG